MKNIYLPAIAALLLFSCTKNPLETPDPVVPAVTYSQFAVTTARVTANTKLLKREVSYLSNNPLLKSVRMFTYDASDRCTEVKIGIIDSSLANPSFDLKQTLTLNYNGSSILPASISSVKTIFPNLVTVFYYTYNSKGLKTKDSVQVKNTAGNPAYRVVNYVYDSGRVTTTPVLSGFPYDNIPFDTLSILQNGNIEKLVSKMTTTTNGVVIATYTFTYDKYISPYNKLNIANSLYFENSSIGLGYNVPLETHYMGVTTNNMTSWTSGTYTVTFKYVYDSDKYPVRKELYYPGDTKPSQVILFEY